MLSNIKAEKLSPYKKTKQWKPTLMYGQMNDKQPLPPLSRIWLFLNDYFHNHLIFSLQPSFQFAGLASD